ncbi:lipoate--protein ligase family protein [Metapseudomonas boanensis]|uniref:Lipoate--protein ligase family protein n=1 Tax=Metapseudomonas boanensis TaxID=2822138 RepID=A0ABS5XBK8_9GAMM|nr:lipoate--protein ligase family protein [Pseudomonas boanensis]MBT8765071.1 lipoate--protein ligase family protein [Pseudomonas boanensis]
MQRISRFGVVEGLDAERRLLDQVQRGEVGCGLLFWRPVEVALVMPQRMSRHAGFDEAQARCAALGWPVALRDTGGEPVPQSPAVLNVALAYALPPREAELTRIERAYLRLCQPMLDWLTQLGLDAGLGEVDGAFCDGRYNVNIEQRKLVGTAQRWRRRREDGCHVVLAHGAVLMENQRESMVDVVNAFYETCGLPDRCRATSHIALDERIADTWAVVDRLWDDYRVALAEAGLALE